jgi:hypothetical protein
MTTHLIDFLFELISPNEKALKWLQLKREKIVCGADANSFFLAFSQASRYFKKESLYLSESQKSQADQHISGFQPEFWDELQTARTILMLSYPQEKESWFKAINQLFETADMNEHQGLFAALPLMPFQEDLIPRAIDGLRTNISSVFDAIALSNPFPAKYFPEANWNQMVLKAIFMQRPIYQIQGLDERRNLPLADIARDFAHERWAAGREVMPEIWRLVVPFMNKDFLKDIESVLDSKDDLQLAAALITLKECNFPLAKQHLKNYHDLLTCMEKGNISWNSVGVDFQLHRL